MATTRTRPPQAPGARPVPTRHRVWPRRVLIFLNIFVAVLIIATASTYGYFKYKFGQIPKIGDLAGVLQSSGDPGDPMTVLLVGSDSRENVSEEERESFGKGAVSGQRADTIIVLHVDPRTQAARMLSIPRDLFVPIAETGRSDRINAAFHDGPQQLIATVTESLGIPIDHYVQVDFNGFRGLVNAVGGVEMYVSSPVRDRVAGLDIRDPGCVKFDGDMALAWVRSRNFQYMEKGQWRTDPTADHGRIKRQQDFVRRIIKEAGEEAKSFNIFTIKDLVNTAVSNVQMDDTFGEGELVSLARRYRSLQPDAVEMLTLPTEGTRVGGASVLKLKQPEAQAVIDQFLQVEPPPDEAPPADVLPSSVGLRVLNGSGTPGQAGDTAAALRANGFNISGVGDASSFGNETTVIRYGRGQRDKALLVRSQLNGGAELQEDLSLRGVDLVVVTGASFEGVAGAAPSSEAPAPTEAPPKEPAKQESPAPPQPQC